MLCGSCRNSHYPEGVINCLIIYGFFVHFCYSSIGDVGLDGDSLAFQI